MAMIFGVPLTAVFYGVLVYYMVVFLRLCRQGVVGREFAVLYLVFLGDLTFSFTAFSLLQSHLMWLALAYLIAVRRMIEVPAGRAKRDYSLSAAPQEARA